MEIRQAMQLEFCEKHETIAKQRHTIMFNMSALIHGTHRLDRVVQRGSSAPMARFADKATMSDNVTNIRLTIEKNGAILEDPFPILVFVGYVEHKK